MANEELNSIDDYERFLITRIETWSPEQRLALAAGIAERWLPTYETFSAAEQWGDPESLLRTLEAIWGHLGGRRLTPENLSRYTQQVQDSTPHMDDFDADEALAACVILSDALASCRTTDNLMFAVQAALSGFEAVAPDWSLDPAAQPRLWQQVAVRNELRAQLRLIEQIEVIARFDDQTIRGLRGALTSSESVGKVSARPKSTTGPVALTNQTAFEQYRRLLESDLKSRSQVDLAGNAITFVIILFSEWLGRYSRRLDTINGNYGRLADISAQQALVARQRARDAAEKGVPGWDPTVRNMIDLCLQHVSEVKRVDANSLEQPHGYGPSLRLLWVEAKRRGESDQAAWQSIIAWAHHRPTAWDVEDRRKKKGLAHATPELGQQLARELTWLTTGDLDYPWATEVDGECWRVRLNDFPDDFMYSLMIDGAGVGDFHDWPETWSQE